jgi:peptidyl-prolyl cis-trans isomerase C
MLCCALGLTASVLALALVLAPAGSAQSADDPIVAKVNGTEIRQSDLTIAEEDVGAQLAQMPPEQKRDYLISYLADVVMVAQAADTRKIGDGKDFKQRLAFARNKLLMETLLQAEGKNAVTDAAMQAVYDDAKKQMGQEQEVHARHILVETEDEAKAVAAELKKGADFAALAKEKSKEPSAKESGGDLGYFTKDQMVPEFADVAFKLDKGQLSDPVKSQFGWHVIKVEDKRQREIPSFPQVKDQIQTYVVRKAQVDLVSKLREGAKIERTEAKPAAPAAPAVPEPKK